MEVVQESVVFVDELVEVAVQVGGSAVDKLTEDDQGVLVQVYFRDARQNKFGKLLVSL